MPKLPDYTALGDLGVYRSDAHTPSYSPQGFFSTAGGKAIEQAGNQMVAAGVALLKKQEAETKQLETARGVSDLTTGLIDLQQEAANDPDFDAATFEPRAKQLQERAAGAFTSPRDRELFTLKSNDDVARARVHVDNVVRKRQYDAEAADIETRAERAAELLPQTTDPEQQRLLRQSTLEAFDGLAARGIKSREWAVQRKRAWGETVGATFLLSQPAERRLELTDTLLAGSNASGKAEARNPRAAGPAPGEDGLPTGGGGLPAQYVAAIKKFEGFTARAKWDYKQYSVGYGTRGIEGETIDRATAEARLKTELDKAGAIVDQVSPNLPEGVRAALVSLTFNSGSKWTTSALGQAVREGDFETAKLRFVQYNKAGGEENPGLVARRNREATWFDNALVGGAPAEQPLRATTGTLADFVSPEKLRVINEAAKSQLFQERTAASINRSDQFERALIDAGAGKGDLPAREAIELDPLLNEDKRNALLKAYDKAAGDVASYQAALRKFVDPAGGPFNAFEKDDRETVDKIYQALGGTTEALQTVVERARILPDSVAKQMRGALISGDPAAVQKALQTATNLQARNPNIFTKVEGAQEFEDAATAFQHYVDDRGMTAAEATQRFIREQTPEYKAAVKARIKNEDIDAMLKKKLDIGNIESGFDRIPWIPFTDPKVGFDPGQRQRMFAQYAEGVKERYLENGDFELAKKQTIEQMKKAWGVTSVSGSEVVVQFPPERAPALAGIEGLPALIAKQAIEAIKAETGQDVDRKALRLAPIPTITAQAYKNGAAPPYMLSWVDKNGLVQMLNPGRAFVPDPQALRQSVQDERQQGFEAARSKLRQSTAAPERAVRKQLRMQAGERLAADSAASEQSAIQPSIDVGIELPAGD